MLARLSSLMFLTDSTLTLTGVIAQTAWLTYHPNRDAGHSLGKQGLGGLWQLCGPHNTQPAQHGPHPTI